jgi:hypothetical protein
VSSAPRGRENRSVLLSHDIVSERRHSRWDLFAAIVWSLTAGGVRRLQQPAMLRVSAALGFQRPVEPFRQIRKRIRRGAQVSVFFS